MVDISFAFLTRFLMRRMLMRLMPTVARKTINATNRSTT